ncbi:NAD(P)-dependent oxidoreductase [Actinophytocola algeriensis]|uniref:3-hydroxyisobutyrate dehydrogenase-like beta-hydroxyacid dehydrogenase n=1 Tax=Actinophytocola algeriensis TaxID=1768010 RepID=A0A7W7PZ35_9PSEU|nr:NAD(P)-binding domain-containing protein [Actinophytocola algeriensis]MBB4903981.1 3-hydroxyisobutyrate dehydrogenase-like beta-hydroxyacid dehydrogenase [Actinophytocola algeriensis]MBE1477162.1 3-hydroxyisobutyrate dehydrogenase-like beta-hydroxyacid dehydrogenase [Actinophytocola algeriensis]
MQTTVIGLGKMGRALATALVERGHDTTVWNRTPGRSGDLAVTHAATAADAFAANELVILCLLDSESVVAVLDGVDVRDRTIVNLTTSTPAEAAKLSALVAERGGDYLDGGIMAIPSMIGTPAAVVLYSGSEQAFRRAEDVLAAFGDRRYLGAEPGLAALNDIAMLTGMYGMFGGFVHAAAMVRTEGVPVVEFTETLLIPWLRGLFPALVGMAAQIDSGDYTAKESDLSMQVANDGIAEVSRAQGVSTELSEPLFTLMRRRVEQGFGGDDFPSVIELLS